MTIESSEQGLLLASEDPLKNRQIIHQRSLKIVTVSMKSTTTFNIYKRKQPTVELHPNHRQTRAPALVEKCHPACRKIITPYHFDHIASKQRSSPKHYPTLVPRRQPGVSCTGVPVDSYHVATAIKHHRRHDHNNYSLTSPRKPTIHEDVRSLKIVTASRTRIAIEPLNQNHPESLTRAAEVPNAPAPVGNCCHSIHGKYNHCHIVTKTSFPR